MQGAVQTNKIKLFIDGSNLIHRSHWVSKNAKISSVYLFLASLKKYAVKFNTNDLTIAWDDKRDQETPNFRRLLIGKKYKGTRDKQKNYEAFKTADDAARVSSCLGIKNMYPNTLEADDIIAWLCKNKYPDGDNIVISTDQDMLQLVDENNRVYSPTKDIIIDVDNFEDITGVTLDEYVQYKAIIGDKSDNIDGIPGAGPKRALKILKEGVSKQSDENKKLFDRNFKLMSLDFSLDTNPTECKHLESHHAQVLKECKTDMKQFENACKYYNMVHIMKNMNEWKQLFDSQSMDETIRDTIANIDFTAGFDK